MVCRLFKYRCCQHIWTYQGGRVTLEVYQKGLSDDIITEDEVKSFFNKQHYYYIDDDNRLFVHGGVRYGVDKDTKLELIWNRELFECVMTGYHLPIADKYKEIFIGHTSTMYYDSDKPINKFNIWNLDTGAGGFGKLTMMNVDTKEYWQSDLMIELYPDILKAR